MASPTRFLTLLLCAALAACHPEDVREKLGLNHRAPDEFRVVARPPLSVPPEFNLTAPGQEPDRPFGTPADARARGQVLGVSPAPASSLAPTAVTPVSAAPLPSAADAQFLSKAGAERVDPQVRQRLDQDQERGLTPKDTRYLLGGKKEGEPTVDAPKEAKRLKDDKAKNKPPTEGETPVIAPKDKGILGDIF